MLFKIHVLINPSLIGDKNQAQGIKTKIVQYYPSQNIEVNTWNDKNKDDLANLNDELKDKKSQHILISIGDHGLEALQNIHFDPNTKIVSIYASHQIFPALKKTIDRIHILALPTYVIDDQVRQDLAGTTIKWVPTLGVAHNLNQAELEQNYLNWQNDSQKPIQTHDNYLAVILGGDAPTPDKTMLYFTANEAKKLAQFLAQLYLKRNKPLLLITNSPRTGKHDPNTKLECKVHTSTTEEIIDATSQALLDELNLQGIPYQFFNYVENKSSAYQPILRAVQKQKDKSAILITGDSSSMITEGLDLLKDTPFFVADVGSMNVNHIKHVQSIHQAGLANHVHLNEQKQYDCTFSDITINAQNRETPAQCIATAVNLYLKNTHPFKLETHHETAGLLFFYKKPGEKETNQNHKKSVTSLVYNE